MNTKSTSSHNGVDTRWGVFIEDRDDLNSADMVDEEDVDIIHFS